MTVGVQRKPWWQTLRGRETISFYLFVLPWIIGFLLFILGPIVASLVFSFTDYDIMLTPSWIGLANFEELFDDPLFYTSLYNTLYLVLIAVPLGMIVSFAIALLLNQKVRFLAVYRTAYYLPSIVPAVASAALWLYLLQPQWGLVNGFLESVGISGPGWLSSEVWSKPAIIMMMVWGAGNTVIIYLAGLQDIPQSLYEASAIDGANRWNQFWRITLPLMTPSLFFTLVLGIIGTFQIFAQIFVLTDGMGGPQNSTLVYMIYLYRNGFNFFRMGYASAMAWVLFVLILLLTWLQFKAAQRWVYYETESAEG
ncbi:MAG: sugar ABC transporter permease [Caldilineaceae bacterium]|nr:sugar ABC transporter permease [Caldilineaceae bacterium]